MANATSILVVEDDRTNRTTLVRLLQHGGMTAHAAGSIEEAMEKLKLQPAIVLLDLNLPDGSGADLLAHIRENKLPIKVCIMTGSALPQTLEDLKQLTPDRIVMKPYHPELLLEWIGDHNA